MGRTLLHAWCALLAAASLGVYACGPKETDEQEEDDALLQRAISAESDVDTTSTALIALQLSSQQGNASSLYRPLGCVSETRANMRATYSFSDCTGPYDVGPITGNFSISGSGDAGFISVRVESEGLTIGDTTLMIDATTNTTITGRKRVTTVNGSLIGKAGDGSTIFTRNVEKTVKATVGDSCVSISGHSGGSIGKATLDVEYADGFQRCGRCPAPGSKLIVTTNRRVRTVDAAALCATLK